MDGRCSYYVVRTDSKGIVTWGKVLLLLQNEHQVVGYKIPSKRMEGILCAEGELPLCQVQIRVIG